MKNYSVRFGSGDPRTFTGLAPTLVVFANLTNGAAQSAPSISESPASSGIYTFQWGTTIPIGFICDAATTSPGTAGRYVTGQLDPADRADEYGTTAIALGNTAVADILNVGTTLLTMGVGGTLTAIGTAQTNMGTTLVAIGNTSIAQGTTEIALGTTSVSWGAAIGSTLGALGNSIVALGNSNIALGTTNVAIGTTIYALEQTLGSTLVAIGNTSIAIGSTILALASAGDSLAAVIGSTASSFGTSSTDPVDLFGYMKRVAELLQGQQNFIKGSGVMSLLDRTGGTTFVVRTVTNSASMVTKT